MGVPAQEEPSLAACAAGAGWLLRICNHPVWMWRLEVESNRHHHRSSNRRIGDAERYLHTYGPAIRPLIETPNPIRGGFFLMKKPPECVP
jgi:hypothetical protein